MTALDLHVGDEITVEVVATRTLRVVQLVPAPDRCGDVLAEAEDPNDPDHFAYFVYDHRDIPPTTLAAIRGSRRTTGGAS